ncbi:DUF6230 family protein [Nocardia tenerifensis]|nr:DUF6230 family protein [Nocardia tenerifensis]
MLSDLMAGQHPRTRWGRFSALFCSGLLVVALTVAGMIYGVVPVSAQLYGEVSIKVSLQHLSTSAGGIFPQAIQSRSDGQIFALKVTLHDTVVEGLCASGRVDSLFGSQVLRISSKPGHQVRIAETSLAMDSFENVEVIAGSLAVDGVSTTPDGLVLIEGYPGRLPIDVRDLKMQLHATIRWTSIQGLSQSGTDMDMGRDVAECF